jgi:hypothetical protein
MKMALTLMETAAMGFERRESVVKDVEHSFGYV